MSYVDAFEYKETLRRLANLDFNEPLEESGQTTVQRTRERITKEITPSGDSFVELAESTLRQKQGEGILKETNALVNSVESLVNGNSCEIYPSGIAYDYVHQFGTSKVPRREYMGFGDEDADKIEELFANWIELLIG